MIWGTFQSSNSFSLQNIQSESDSEPEYEAPKYNKPPQYQRATTNVNGRAQQRVMKEWVLNWSYSSLQHYKLSIIDSIINSIINSPDCIVLFRIQLLPFNSQSARARRLSEAHSLAQSVSRITDLISQSISDDDAITQLISPTRKLWVSQTLHFIHRAGARSNITDLNSQSIMIIDDITQHVLSSPESLWVSQIHNFGTFKTKVITS